MNYLTTLNEVIKLLQDLKILEKVAPKLMNNPDAAAEKLAVVLNELAKSYQTLDDALVNMATLSFQSQQEIEEARRYLLEVQGGRVGVEMAKARGHCEKIWNSYEKHLRGWFSRVLNRQEASQLERLFYQLHDVDRILISAIEQISGDLQKIADELQKLVDQNKNPEAQQKVKTLAREFREPRRALSQGMMRLWRLQAEFTSVSGVV